MLKLVNENLNKKQKQSKFFHKKAPISIGA